MAFGFGIRHLTPLQTIPFFLLGGRRRAPVPATGPSKRRSRPPPHSEHVEERYGLFTIIILGEMVLVASAAFNTALTDHKHLATLMVGAISAGILAFCLWWLYFGFLGEYDLTRNRTAFVWGYGHYFIYGALTAIGGSLAALLEQVARGDGALSRTAMALTLTVPVAGFLSAIALLRKVSEWAACSRWLMAAAWSSRSAPPRAPRGARCGRCCPFASRPPPSSLRRSSRRGRRRPDAGKTRVLLKPASLPPPASRRHCRRCRQS